VKRDRDMDALAEALQQAQTDRPSWLARLARRGLVKAGPFALFAVAACVLLARTGVDLGGLLMVMFYGSPVLAVAVVSFIVHAWRQNSTTPVYGAGQVGQAEPGQVADEVGRPAPVGQDVEVGQPATPVRPVTVTATVVDLPTPAGELPAAPAELIPTWGTPDYAHERNETKEEIT
jgi:hypothetical protein